MQAAVERAFPGIRITRLKRSLEIGGPELRHDDHIHKQL
jgi:hypothetical protein